MSRRPFLPAPPAAFLELSGSWLATLLIVTLLGYFLLEAFSTQQSRRTQESHLLVRLSHTRDSVEAALELGFPIGELPRAQALLEDLLMKDSTLLALDIFDSQGFIRFSTDRGSIGDAAPDSWKRIYGKDIFSTGARDTRAIGVALRGSFGEVEGYVVATYRPGMSTAGHPGRLVAALCGVALAALLAVARFLSRSSDARSAMDFSPHAPPEDPTDKLAVPRSRLSAYDHRFAAALNTLENRDREA